MLWSYTSTFLAYRKNKKHTYSVAPYYHCEHSFLKLPSLLSERRKMTFGCLRLVIGEHSYSPRAWDRPEGPVLVPAPHGHISAAVGQLLPLPMGSRCANSLQKRLV